jgi:calcineurin-like phosphoesterase family protein
MAKTFLTSDLHFFHTNVIDFCKRPYGSIEHMNAELIKNWQSVVGAHDHVWFLGDFSFGNYDQTASVLEQLPGIKHLIVGNHDRKGRAEKLFNRDWKRFFADSHDYYRLKTPLGKAVLCHFPFASWERGYYNFHGHLHSPAGYANKWKQYDVGADANNYTPLLLEDAIKRADSGTKLIL